MEYVVGSVAALITGNVTPNRPKLMRRALTPTKHQPSPNVTPKSEFVDDRSIFLSPSVQKKKDVLKKSPKRIFQNPDLDVSNDIDGVSALTSPKAEKVKKHLKSDLEADTAAKNVTLSPKSPKPNKGKLNKVIESPDQKKKIKTDISNHDGAITQSSNENTPKKKKKQRNQSHNANETVSDKENASETSSTLTDSNQKPKNKRKLSIEMNAATESLDPTVRQSPKKKKKNKTNQRAVTQEKKDNPQASKSDTATKSEITKKKNKNKKQNKKKNARQENNAKNQPNKNQSLAATDQDSDDDSDKEPAVVTAKTNKSKINPRIKSAHTSDAENESETEPTESQISDERQSKKKNKAKLRKKQPINNQDSDSDDDSKTEQEYSNSKLNKKKKKSKVNPNAITNQNTDSEHESDDEIDSENEQINTKIFKTEPTIKNSSSEEEDEEAEIKDKHKKPQPKEQLDPDDPEVVKRTLFVGNVAFSKKCKKEIKSFFSKYGHIETVRIRTIPVKDARVTPKLAVIRNELHPERTTVNVYVKFSDPASVDKALSANNTVLNGCHLRVTRSDHSGAHDASRSVFVGNLPFALEDDGLRAVFASCGDIDSVRIVRDRVTNAGKGFGYVNFASKDGVELALSLSEEDLTIKNRIIRVKRCSQFPQKQKNQGQGNPKFQERNQGGGKFQDRNQADSFQGGRNQGRNPGGNFQGRNPGGNFQARNQRGDFQGRNEGGSFQGRNRGDNFQGRNQGGGFQGRNQGGNFQGRNPGGNFQGRNQGGNFQGRNQGGKQARSQGDRQRVNEGSEEGAFRRIMKKRQNQEAAAGPPSKVPRSDPDAGKDKKPRKEFVGMTAEKKKKHKFNKGLKKKKVLSEILAK